MISQVLGLEDFKVVYDYLTDELMVECHRYGRCNWAWRNGQSLLSVDTIFDTAVQHLMEAHRDKESDRSE